MTGGADSAETVASPAGDETRVVLTGTCEGLADVFRALGEHPAIELAGWREDVRKASELLVRTRPAVVLHGARETDRLLADLAVIRECSQAAVVVATSPHESSIIERSFDANVADVLLLPQEPESIVFAVRKAARGVPGGSVVERASEEPGRLLTVFAPRGGSGKSVIATNVAIALSLLGRRTLLLDLDIGFGSCSLLLGMAPDLTLSDLTESPGALDDDKLAGYTTRHPSGLDVLPAPVRPEDFRSVTEDKVKRILHVARAQYEAVVVDTSSLFYDAMLATLDRTDELILVCSPDLPSIENVRKSLETLDLLSFPIERIRLVVNQPNPDHALSTAEVSEGVGLDATTTIPYDPGVPAEANRGNAPVLRGKGGFARAVRQMTQSLVPSDS